MAGNSLGKLFKITTFGESHGGAVGVVIDGVKPNVKFSTAPIQRELDRRRPGQSNVTTARNETDQVHVLSGVFKGKTLGTPICLIVWNKDQNSKAYAAIKDVFRPGHAGFTYVSKFGIQDYRVSPLGALRNKSSPGGESKFSRTRSKPAASVRRRSSIPKSNAIR